MLAPRDNVLFELGLFLGRLGRERAFYLYDDAIKVKLPSDLAGITGASYTHDDNLLASLGPACNKIRGPMAEIGLRFKPDNETHKAFERHYAFAKILSVGGGNSFWLPNQGGLVLLGSNRITQPLR